MKKCLAPVALCYMPKLMPITILRSGRIFPLATMAQGSWNVFLPSTEQTAGVAEREMVATDSLHCVGAKRPLWSI